MVSIVIPAYNEEAQISKVLNSLSQQKADFQFEVIVVNNGSTDSTTDIASSYKNRLAISVINELKKGRGSARAAGFAVAKGDIILSTDADAVVPSDWIEKMIEHFKNPKIIAVTGIFRIQDCSFITNSIFNIISFLSTYLYRMIFGYFWVCGANFAVRKNAYRTVGGFSKIANGMEDVELSSRLRKHGKIIFDPNLIVITSGRRLKGRFLQGLYEYLRSFVDFNLLNKKQIYLNDIR